ncbi:HNH endonuclease, partial [Actinomadura darangshiensis]
METGGGLAVAALTVVDDARAEIGEWEGRGWFPPGPQLAICLSGGLDGLSDTELMEVAAAARRQTSWAQARELAAIAELSRRRTAAETEDDPDYRVLSAHESVVEEVAVALNVTGNAAATLVHVADRLADDLHGTREALATGQIDLAKTRVICDLTDGLPDGLDERVEAAVLDKAPGQTTGQLRRRIRRIVQRLAPERLEERKREAVRRRDLQVWDTPDGTSDLTLTGLETSEAHAIFNKITAVARGLKGDGDARPLHAIRADLAKVLLRGVPFPEAAHALPGAIESPHTVAIPRVTEAPHPDMSVVETLARMVDQRLTKVATHARAGGRTNALPLIITRAVQDMHEQLRGLRESWCQATGRTPDQHGHNGYRPPAEMRRVIEARHETCVFPTCNRRSNRCDLDHTIPWGRGTTCPCNLAPLCRRHHRTKQSPGWTLIQPWPGLLIWITPSGNWHITLPT